MIDDLHEAILDDNENEVREILAEYAMRWFGFGMGVGCVVTSIFYWFIK